MECICSSCKHLKSVTDESLMDENDIDDIDESGAAETYECEFGYPAQSCEDCEVDGCELTCVHYVKEGAEEDFVLATCTTCGKELKLAAGNDAAGDVYCVTCYLSKE